MEGVVEMMKIVIQQCIIIHFALTRSRPSRLCSFSFSRDHFDI